MSIPTTMRAVKVVNSQPGEPKVALVTDAPVPKPAPNEVLVRVHAAGLNPTDWKHANGLTAQVEGATSGCDYAGVVAQVGAEVTNLKVGDRVLGVVHGSNPLSKDNGAFSEYVVNLAALVVPIPERVSFESAAGAAVAAFTTAQMLWQSQSLPTPQKPGDGTTDFLVWSGATGVGQWLIQLAKLSGLRVITTASLKHTDHLKRLGAVEVIDYRDPDVVQKIRAATNGKLRSVGVCEFTPTDFHKIVESFSDDGGELSLLGVPPNDTKELMATRKVKWEISVAYTIHGREVKTPIPIPAQPEHFVASEGYTLTIKDLIANGKVELAPVRVVGGLESVWTAMEDMRLGKVSGERIIFKVAE